MGPGRETYSKPTELNQTNESSWTQKKHVFYKCDATSITEGGGTILTHAVGPQGETCLKLSTDEVMKRLLELDLNFVYHTAMTM